MISNIERYKKDFDRLILVGKRLLTTMKIECSPEELQELEKKDEEKYKILSSFPSIKDSYQSWYSEAKTLIKQLLQDRLEDFVRHYETPKSRKEITYENYRIEDYLQGLVITRGSWKEKVVGPDAAIPHLQQQIAILNSLKSRFESSLFDIQQLTQADLFDSELDAAKELAKNRFTRAAGAMVGVVLEKHLSQICQNHSIAPKKKVPTISDFNDALKQNNIIDIPYWRFVQHLGDLRNLCDHDKKTEPTIEQVDDLIAGVMKITKTLF